MLPDPTRLGSLLVRTSTNLFSLKLPKLVEEDDNHVTLVPHTRNCDLFSFGSVGGDSFFLCAAVGCTVNILNDAFEKVQSVEMPAVLEVLEVTSLGVAVAHGTSYTLVKLTSEGLISQVWIPFLVACGWLFGANLIFGCQRLVVFFWGGGGLSFFFVVGL